MYDWTYRNAITKSSSAVSTNTNGIPYSTNTVLSCKHYRLIVNAQNALYQPLRTLFRLLSKTWDSFDRACVVPMRLSITKLFLAFDEVFKNSYDISRDSNFRWPILHLNLLRTVGA